MMTMMVVPRRMVVVVCVAILASCCWLLLFTAEMTTAAATADTTAKASTIQCVTSYSLHAPVLVDVADTKINDGYCDCIYTGEDETSTDACSGYETWPGNSIASDHHHRKENNDVYFTCPQQPKLQISYSRVNDGVCDCCDGADEKTTGNNNVVVAAVECIDNCADIVQAEIQAKAILQEKYTHGSKIRLQAINEYQTLYEQVQKELIVQEQQLTSNIEPSITNQKDVIEQMKIKYMKRRIGDMKKYIEFISLYSNEIVPISAMNLQELQWFLVYSCQLSGEIVGYGKDEENTNNNDNNNNIKTCIPLRLAGLDHGITWSEKTYALHRTAAATGGGDDVDENTKHDDDDDDDADVFIDLADMTLFNNNYNPNTIINNNKTTSTTSTKVWTTKMLTAKKQKRQKHSRDTNSGRRRLTAELDEEEDEYDDPYEDVDNDIMENDTEEEEEEENEDDDDRESRHSPKHNYRSDKNDNKSPTMDDISETTNKDELLTKIKSTRFAASRNVFATRSQTLLEQIELYLKEVQKDEDDEKDDEVVEGDDEKESGGTISNNSDNEGKQEDTENSKVDTDVVTKPTISIDPMKLTMIRNKLESRTKKIDRGIDYAVSALVLIDAIMDALQDDYVEIKRILRQLIAGTVRHGNLSAVHIYQILQATLPEFSQTDQDNNDDIDSDTQNTCKSPWADLCPPYSFERNITEFNEDKTIQIPSISIITAVQKFCDDRLAEPMPSGDGFCKNPDSPADSAAEEGGIVAAVADIPDDIPNGFNGYTVVARRAEDDILNSMLHDDAMTAIVQADSDFGAQISGMEDELDRLENEKNSVLKKIKELKDSVGIDDKSKHNNKKAETTKFGPDGELHSIRDSCFEVKAGKYIYKVCMYKSAKQRDEGGDENGGTDLGRWNGIGIEEDDDGAVVKRIWKWENGAKCWNGPERSATVYVTCGQENKLLSAEEPDTCRYVFEMESPIGCDEQFRIAHGL